MNARAMGLVVVVFASACGASEKDKLAGGREGGSEVRGITFSAPTPCRTARLPSWIEGEDPLPPMATDETID
jgi:hypothetical protein